jgi:hypothetical protein
VVRKRAWERIRGGERVRKKADKEREREDK